MLRWLPVWSTCTMLELFMQIQEIKTWKNDWAIVYDILKGKDNSSFGWDEHRQMVVTEDAVWNSYIS
ncbi:hypothetical protein Golax_014118, partial [Gossypium laxum]|nr:hypothetical protein [Gossypium laxum]